MVASLLCLMRRSSRGNFHMGKYVGWIVCWEWEQKEARGMQWRHREKLPGRTLIFHILLEFYNARIYVSKTYLYNTPLATEHRFPFA
jgi:hypothetical protein